MPVAATVVIGAPSSSKRMIADSRLLVTATKPEQMRFVALLQRTVSDVEDANLSLRRRRPEVE